MKENKQPVYYAGKPFVQWAGGKRKLLPVIQANLPRDFVDYHTYIEPFVGGGAVFYRIRQCYPNKKFVLNDFNVNLITTYRIIRDHPESLIRLLQEKQNLYYQLKNEEERKSYYLGQRELFNGNSLDDMGIAVMMIFLNKTCFSGLYRENKSGAFNVGFGKLERPHICDSKLIRANSELLQGVILLSGDYQQTQQYAEKGCFYYFDPPYKPISKTASFRSYTKQDFGDDEQIRLAQFCFTIQQKGASWMQSNSDVKNYEPDNEFFDDLYIESHISRVSITRDMGSCGGKNIRIANYELLKSELGK